MHIQIYLTSFDEALRNSQQIFSIYIEFNEMHHVQFNFVIANWVFSLSLFHFLSPSLSLFADNFHLIMQFKQVRFADLIVWKII